MAAPLPSEDDRTVQPVPPGARPGAAQPAASAPRTAPLPIGTRLRHFRITGHVGEGGFGIVYTAHDDHLKRIVAIKEYMPSSLAWRCADGTIAPLSEQHRKTFEAGLNSFRNEARLLAHFDHPGLVKVYEYWDANGTAYMVTPFYEGPTLKNYLRELGAPPAEPWLKTLLQLLIGALEAMHGKQCMHRDISPDNILIRPNGVPVLLDFGAARRVINNMTQALTVILKPGYAPIEQYASSSTNEQGPWTDVYALAAVAYFAITGKAPLPSVSRIMSDTLPPLSQVAEGRYSASFLAGLDRALSLRPEQRPQNMRELARALGIDEVTTQLATVQVTAPVSLARVESRTSEQQSIAAVETRADASAQKPAAALRARKWLVVLAAALATITLAVIGVKTGERTERDASHVDTPSTSTTATTTETRSPEREQAPVTAPAPQDATPRAAESAPTPRAEDPQKTTPPAERIAPAQRPEPLPPPQASVKRNPKAPAAQRQESTRTQVTEAKSRKSPGTLDARCTDALSRLQIGETLSREELSYFQKECKR